MVIWAPLWQLTTWSSRASSVGCVDCPNYRIFQCQSAKFSDFDIWQFGIWYKNFLCPSLLVRKSWHLWPTNCVRSSSTLTAISNIFCLVDGWLIGRPHWVNIIFCGFEHWKAFENVPFSPHTHQISLVTFRSFCTNILYTALLHNVVPTNIIITTCCMWRIQKILPSCTISYLVVCFSCVTR